MSVIHFELATLDDACRAIKGIDGGTIVIHLQQPRGWNQLMRPA